MESLLGSGQTHWRHWLAGSSKPCHNRDQMNTTTTFTHKASQVQSLSQMLQFQRPSPALIVAGLLFGAP